MGCTFILQMTGNDENNYHNTNDSNKITGDLLVMYCELLDYSLGTLIYEARLLYEIIVAIQHSLRENRRYVTD